MGAATGALGADHVQGLFGSGAATIFFGAIEMDTGTAWDANLFGDGLVMGDLVGDGLDHAALTALGIALDDNLLGNKVIFAGFDLAGFCAVAGGLGGTAEHRAARRETEGNGYEGNKNKQIFHGSIGYWLGL